MRVAVYQRAYTGCVRVRARARERVNRIDAGKFVFRWSNAYSYWASKRLNFSLRRMAEDLLVDATAGTLLLRRGLALPVCC